MSSPSTAKLEKKRVLREKFALVCRPNVACAMLDVSEPKLYELINECAQDHCRFDQQIYCRSARRRKSQEGSSAIAWPAATCISIGSTRNTSDNTITAWPPTPSGRPSINDTLNTNEPAWSSGSSHSPARQRRIARRNFQTLSRIEADEVGVSADFGSFFAALRGEV